MAPPFSNTTTTFSPSMAELPEEPNENEWDDNQEGKEEEFQSDDDVFGGSRPSRRIKKVKNVKQEEEEGEEQEEHQETVCEHFANESRMHHEAHSVLQHMFRQARGADCIIKKFIRWVTADDTHWRKFWSRFRQDGTMTWDEFEKFVHWDYHWTGECQEAFELLEHNHCGYITNTRCLELKRWWQHSSDLAEGTLDELRGKIMEHWGSMAKAWRTAFDRHDRGNCCFSTFTRILHDTLGVKTRLRALWSEMTDGHVTRNIYYRDLDPEGDMVVQLFATTLTLHGGCLRSGWQQLIADQGGQLHRGAFCDQCAIWGIGMKAARWLFGALDKYGRKVLTEYDDMTFLLRYDPGEIDPGADLTQCRQSVTGSGSVKNPFKIGFEFAGVSDAAEDDEDEQVLTERAKRKTQQRFELEVTLTAEEYRDYQQRLRASLLIRGIDLIGEAKTKERLRTSPPKPQLPNAHCHPPALNQPAGMS